MNFNSKFICTAYSHFERKNLKSDRPFLEKLKQTNSIDSYQLSVFQEEKPFIVRAC
jgi:hypothetical protein